MFQVSAKGKEAAVAAMPAKYRLIIKILSMHPMTQDNCVEVCNELVDRCGSVQAALDAIERGEVRLEPADSKD
jgi:hypothetical protein